MAEEAFCWGQEVQHPSCVIIRGLCGAGGPQVPPGHGTELLRALFVQRGHCFIKAQSCYRLSAGRFLPAAFHVPGGGPLSVAADQIQEVVFHVIQRHSGFSQPAL